MPVFDPLTAASLFILASSRMEPIKCEPPARAQINVIPKTGEIKYDFQQSLVTMQKTPINPELEASKGLHSSSITQGFMQGEVKMSRKVNLDHQVITRKRGRKEEHFACVWFKSIDITIEIDPKIVVAKEVHRDRCMGPAVLEHETKHVNVDRRVVNQTAKEIARRLYDELSADGGFVRGPFDIEQAQAEGEKMVRLVETITQEEYDRMAAERRLQQDAVDTVEEYERVAAVCPDFPERQRSLYQRALLARQRGSQ